MTAPAATMPADAVLSVRGLAVDFATRRRTVRAFSDRPLPAGVVEDCLRTAGTAPSGANLQPWHFVVVTNPAVKHRIRLAAEAEAQLKQGHRISARDNYLRACNYHRSSEFFLHANPDDPRPRTLAPTPGGSAARG